MIRRFKMNQWIVNFSSMIQWLSESLNQWKIESTKQWTNESLNLGSSEPMDSMAQRFNESMNQWIKDAKNHWITESKNQSPFFTILTCKSNSRYSLVSIFPAISSRHALNITKHGSFLRLQSGNRARAVWRRFSAKSAPNMRVDFFGEVSFTFFRTDLPKVLQAYLFLTILKCASSSRYTALCTFCRRLSQIYRPATAETETLLRRHQEPHHPKKHRVSRPRVFFFAREFTRAETVTLPNYLMMGLTWWWG